MKYKPGDQFILTVKSGMIGADEPNYLIDGIFFLQESTLDKLEAYDEIKERLELIEELKQAEYKRGLDDAWEAARKIANSPGNGGFPELYSIFGSYSYSAVLNGLKAAEAIAKIRAYEESQEIHVGDEVTCKGYGGKSVVTHVNDKDATILHWLGGASFVKKDHLTKTGRHFPEVAALLNKMKGDADESD